MVFCSVTMPSDACGPTKPFSGSQKRIPNPTAVPHRTTPYSTVPQVMSAGAIPVFVVRDWIKPFQEQIDWPSFSFTFTPDQVGPSMVQVLRAVPPDQLRFMQVSLLLRVRLGLICRWWHSGWMHPWSQQAGMCGSHRSTCVSIDISSFLFSLNQPLVLASLTALKSRWGSAVVFSAGRPRGWTFHQSFLLVEAAHATRLGNRLKRDSKSMCTTIEGHTFFC